jgi:hypothetical protein
MTSRTAVSWAELRPRPVAWARSADAAFSIAVARVGLPSAWAAGERAAASRVAVVTATPAVARRRVPRTCCRIRLICLLGEALD